MIDRDAFILATGQNSFLLNFKTWNIVVGLIESIYGFKM